MKIAKDFTMDARRLKQDSKQPESSVDFETRVAKPFIKALLQESQESPVLPAEVLALFVVDRRNCADLHEDECKE